MLKSVVTEEKKETIALGQGQITHQGQNFDVNAKASSLWPFVASLKRTSSTSDFTETSCHFSSLLQV